MPLRSRRLVVTLGAAFVSVSVVTLLMAIGLELYFSYQGQDKVVAVRQQLIGREAANTVRGFIEKKLSLLEASARLGRLASASPDAQRTVLEQLLGLEPAFRELVLLDAEQQEVVKASRLSSFAQRTLLAEADAPLVSALRQGRVYVSSRVVIDPSTSEPMLLMAVPVTDLLQETHGALVAEVNLKFMWDVVGAIRVGDQGRAYVVDERGDLIAFGDISRVLKGENLVHLREVDAFVHGRQDPSTQASITIAQGIEGTRVVTSHEPLGMPNWAVVVELPVREAYDAVIQVVRLSAVTAFFSLLLAVMVGAFLSRRITRPIIALRDAALDIGRGNLSRRIEIDAQDEIGDLVRALNQMTRDLQQSTTSIVGLNKEVTERKKAQQDLVQLLSLHSATLQATRDGILVVGIDGRVTSYNQKFLELWRIPESLAAARDDEKLLAYVLDQLVDPEAFLAQVRALYADPEQESLDVLSFKDGRVFERSSQPQKIADQITGRVWSFHDITERRRAEVALREKIDQVERFNKIMMNREERILELKRETNDLLQQLGQSPRYSA